MEKYGVLTTEVEEPKKEEVLLKDLLKKQREIDRGKVAKKSRENVPPGPSVMPGNSGKKGPRRG